MGKAAIPASLATLLLTIGLTLGLPTGARAVEGTAAPPDPTAAEAERERRIQDRTERAKREAEFNQLDQDGDGYLSQAEVRVKEDLEPPAEALDRDGDGRISRTEFAAVETSAGPDNAAAPRP